MPRRVFEIKLEYINPGGLSPKRVQEESERLTRRAGKIAAEHILDFIQMLLSKGYIHRTSGRAVGATGAASENFKIQRLESKGGKTSYLVTEAGMTAANKYIQEGIPPGLIKSLKQLRVWAGAKGLKIWHYDDYQGKSDTERDNADKFIPKIIEGYQRRTGWVRGHGKAPAYGKKSLDSGLSAIGTKLYQEGTDRKEAAWSPLYPSGEGKFDYMAYVFRKREDVLRERLYDASEDVATGIIDYWSRTMKKGGFRYIRV